MMPFQRSGATIIAHLSDIEREVLRDLAEQLVALLEGRVMEESGSDPTASSATSSSAASSAPSVAALLAQVGIGGSASAPLDPALARMLPQAYTDDEAASAEYRSLTELGLIERKIAHARAVSATLATGVVELDRTAAQSWLRTLTDLRLTLAARLQIDDESEPGNDSGSAPNSGDEAMLVVYDWLGYLQGTLLDEIEQLEGEQSEGEQSEGGQLGGDYEA
jgi:Domain of unknown function (DUF2017)